MNYSLVNKQLVSDLEDEILQKAISIFIKSTQQDIEHFSIYIKKKQFPEIANICHKIAGASVSVGFEKFSELAKIIEQNNGIQFQN